MTYCVTSCRQGCLLWFVVQTPDRPQQSRLPPPNKPSTSADNEDENGAVDSEAHEEGMETNDDREMTAERLRSTFHSSDMALAFERLVRASCVLC